jgi:tetratricopeptide (TPR) repeat protein
MNREDLILKKLKNGLSQEENAEFERLMLFDAAFKEEFLFEQEVKMAVQLEDRQQLKDRLVNHEQKKNTPKWYWAAAAVLLLGISTAVWFLFNASLPSSDLYTANYEKFPNVILPETRSDVKGEEYLKSAFMAYKAGEYKKAYGLFGKLENEKSAPFYQGICLIELGDFKKAEEYFEKISFGDDFEEHRLWYLSLIYIHEKKEELAKPLLQYLVESQSVWAAKAEPLLEEI